MDEKVDQLEFDDITKKFSGIETYRGDIWYRCRTLLNKGYIYEAYTLLLATWNFARFRYFMKYLNPEKFLKIIDETEKLHKTLDSLDIRSFNFNSEDLLEKIKDIYEIFREIKGIEQTGASKLLSLRNPELFVMWDTKIRKKYNIDNKGTAEDYIKFLQIIQKRFKHLKWESKDKTFTKAIDEYNFYKIH